MAIIGRPLAKGNEKGKVKQQGMYVCIVHCTLYIKISKGGASLSFRRPAPFDPPPQTHSLTHSPFRLSHLKSPPPPSFSHTLCILSAPLPPAGLPPPPTTLGGRKGKKEAGRGKGHRGRVPEKKKKKRFFFFLF